MQTEFALSDDHVSLGDTWQSWVRVTSDDGTAMEATSVTVSVTTPTTPTTGTAAETDDPGLYLLTYTTTIVGEHHITITVIGDTQTSSHGYTVTVTNLTGTPPTLDECVAYLGDTSWTGTEISGALAAETAAQSRVCRIPSDWPADLREALKRRVAKNLAVRDVKITTITTFDGGVTSARVPTKDPEIARLEAPYKKWVIA